MKLLTPKQVAEQYPFLSISLIYQLCEEKRLTHYRIGGKGKRGKLLLDPADIERFLAEQRVESR